MMKRRRIWLLGAVVVVIVVAIVRFVLWPARTPPPSPTEFVPMTWEGARKTPMHDLHVGKQHLPCTSCHEQGWSEAPQLSSCSTSHCHASAAANAHRGNDTTKTDCLTCHVFKAAARPIACVDCHGSHSNAAAAPSLAHHASSSVACTTCHDPHGEGGARTRRVDCTECHSRTNAAHGRFETRSPDDAGDDAGDEKRVHVANAKERIERSAMCTDCHRPHQGKEEARAQCAACHVARPSAISAPQVQPRGRGVAGHETCTTCHAPHDARAADVRTCASCHQDRTAAVVRTGHSACTSCHAPHAPSEARESCDGCHKGKSTLASRRVPVHAECVSCHDPHRPDLPPEASCARCHSNVSAKHATKTACIDCHTPHPASPVSPVAKACSSCHVAAKNDRSFHAQAVECQACHTPHAFSLPSARANAAPANVEASVTLCSRCHAEPAREVKARAGHAVCTACHGEPHTPTASPSCASCHRAETQTAPKGHATCTNCHDGHSGALGSHASCTSCHGDKRTATHGNLTGGCETCHAPHGPKGVLTPPACSSCHAVAKLPGLHSVPAHAATCKTCHTSHGLPRSERATCTTGCHADRRQHQPEAAVCKGCHLFRD